MQIGIKGMENIESARSFLKQLWAEAGDENSESYWAAKHYEEVVEDHFGVKL